ncbi:hypothetical protein NQZ68_018805 [Dissostichus eleginoides]|nr:hypothetical protein NQZ68_018805 [Dissostichus eleginoides]
MYKYCSRLNSEALTVSSTILFLENDKTKTLMMAADSEDKTGFGGLVDNIDFLMAKQLIHLPSSIPEVRESSVRFFRHADQVCLLGPLGELHIQAPCQGRRLMTVLMVPLVQLHIWAQWRKKTTVLMRLSSSDDRVSTASTSKSQHFLIHFKVSSKALANRE